MPACARGSARPSGRGVRRLAAALAGGIALAASAQPYRIPDLKPAAPRVAPAPPAGAACVNCGKILSIREITIDSSRGVPTPAPVGTGTGGTDPGNPTNQNLIGAVIYLPFGGQGPDKPYIGGVGTPEMSKRFSETTYEITVRLDDGSYRFVRRPDGAQFGVGDRVRWLGSDDLEILVN
ncbi:MAG TPA: hypothetical protein VML91_05440 [Burkholderiales bacterium]|nr:hypothetical protein [Burkholderiales bacterium]